jgi:hypothetical protein
LLSWLELRKHFKAANGGSLDTVGSLAWQPWPDVLKADRARQWLYRLCMYFMILIGYS